MEKIKLFEIPIYSMLEKVYEKRCYNCVEKEASKTSSDNYEDFYTYLKDLYFIRRPWIYNQIIGYIVISFYQNSIWFDEYATTDRRIHALGDKKHYIKDMRLTGYHFYVSDRMANTQIKQEIIKFIKSIETEILHKPWSLEKDAFMKQLKYIDIRKLINAERN